jgi:uncharacterized DUF497 family protein
MAELRFEWDPRKAALNLKKHGVSFTEAETAFADEAGRLLDDPDSPASEDRYILMGFSGKGRLLVVVHTYRAEEAVIRIISARKADRGERGEYEEQEDL